MDQQKMYLNRNGQIRLKTELLTMAATFISNMLNKAGFVEMAGRNVIKL